MEQSRERSKPRGPGQCPRAHASSFASAGQGGDARGKASNGAPGVVPSPIMTERRDARTGKTVGDPGIGESVVHVVAICCLGALLIIAGASSWSYLFHSVLVVLGLVCFVGARDVFTSRRLARDRGDRLHGRRVTRDRVIARAATPPAIGRPTLAIGSRTLADSAESLLQTNAGFGVALGRINSVPGVGGTTPGPARPT